MALTVEDGSLVADANSYSTVQEAKDYSSLRGVELPADDSAVEAMLIKAMDYLESFGDRFKGCKVDAGQSLQWPREGVVIDGFDQAEDEIPRLVKYAQLALTCEIAEGNDPFSQTEQSGAVTEERVEGAVTVKYAATKNQKIMPVSATSKSAAMISALLERGGLGLAIKTQRV